MNRLLQWLVPMRRRVADLSASSVPPFPEGNDPASPFARADRAMQGWLVRAGAGWRVASCRVLQPAAPLEHSAADVFEFVLAAPSGHDERG